MSTQPGENGPVLPFVIWIGLAFAVGMGVWGGVYRNVDWPDGAPSPMIVSLGNAGLTLAVGGVLGGIVKLLFDALAARRERHEATQVFYRNILDDLKAIYDEMERSRLLIEAHQSARTYGEQMRKLPDAVIRLRNIERALRPGFARLERELGDPLAGLTDFLTELLDEYRKRYIDISRLQSQDEATNAYSRKLVAEGKRDAHDVTLSTAAWDEIRTLPKLRTVRLAETGGTNPQSVAYKARFVDHIDDASRTLRRRLDTTPDA